jgi:hypothetical protein
MNTTIENPMVRYTDRPARILGKCACGCGQVIEEGYEFIEWDGRYFVDYPCLMSYLGAQWRT